MATTDWEIGRTTLVCATTGRELAEEEEIYSAIFDENRQFVRRDYGLESWPPEKLDEAYSYWKTRVPKKDAPIKKYVDDEVIMDFFARLEGHGDEQKKNFRYVLALFLMRKKRLKFTEIKHRGDDMVMILYERVSQKDHEVVDPRLTEEQVIQVSEEVGQILNTRI
jgi:hypothetical protein